MVVVVAQTVDFGFLVLKVDKSGDDFGTDAQGVDELGEFLLLSL